MRGAPAAARPSRPDGRLLWGCVGVSLAAHVLLLRFSWLAVPHDGPHEVEFDLTLNEELGPGGPPVPHAARPAPASPPAPAEGWDAAAGRTSPSPLDVPAGGDEARPQAGGGSGDGGEAGGGSGVTAAPRLLNLGQLERLLDRFYPESERRLGHDGLVLLDLSLDDEGHVVGVEVAASSDPAFEPAARQVAARLRFSPARAGARAVSVKIRQPIQFRLKED